MLIAYVDQALTEYLDVRRLASCILGIWRCYGLVDNLSYVQGLTQALVIIHCPHVSIASEQRVWSLEEHIGLPALQPVLCLTGSCMGACI